MTPEKNPLKISFGGSTCSKHLELLEELHVGATPAILKVWDWTNKGRLRPTDTE